MFSRICVFFITGLSHPLTHNQVLQEPEQPFRPFYDVGLDTAKDKLSRAQRG